MLDFTSGFIGVWLHKVQPEGELSVGRTLEGDGSDPAEDRREYDGNRTCPSSRSANEPSGSGRAGV